jgi:hypothetical protein
MRVLDFLIGLGILLALQIGSARAEDSLTLILDADPASEVEGAYVVDDFGDIKLDTQIVDGALQARVEPGKLSTNYHNVLLRWKDGTSSAFPILFSSAFVNRTLHVYMTKTVDNSKCIDGTPKGVEDAFTNLYRCAMSTSLLEDQGRKWTKAHRRALNGWLIANHWLYTRSTPSPYGLDPELVERLQAVADDPDTTRENDKYSPLTLRDVAATLKLYREQNVRLAGLVPALIQLGKLQEAGSVNTSAKETYLSLGEATGKKSPIAGVNLDVLLGNEAYIQTKSSAQQM